MNWVLEKDNLQRLLNEENRTYNEVGILYGCSGGNIKKVVQRLGIVVPPRRKININETFNKGTTKYPTFVCLNCGKEAIKYGSSQGKFCSIKCQKEYLHKQLYQKVIDGDPSIMRANYVPSLFKEDILKEQDNKCAICGMPPEWNNKPIVFILDHIDGHASNNRRDNLRLICPNCDSQLDTYKSKNKNSDRIYHHINHR